MLITDRIRQAFDSDSLVTPRLALDFASECGGSLLRQFAERSDWQEWARPSGWNCARKKACVKHGIEGDALELRAVTTFFIGDLLEAAFVAMALSAGVDLRFTGRDQLTLPTALGDGHTDGINFVDGSGEAVVELKSMSDYGFQRIRRMPDECSVTELDDTFGYATQANAYMWAAIEEDYISEPRMRFIAISKQNFAFTEKVLLGDEGLLAARALEFKAIEGSESPWELNRFEPDFKKDREVLPVQCAYCPFKAPCWAADGHELRLEESGRSKSWVIEGGS